MSSIPAFSTSLVISEVDWGPPSPLTWDEMVASLPSPPPHIPNQAVWKIVEYLDESEKKVVTCVSRQWKAAFLPSGSFQNLPPEVLWQCVQLLPRVVQQNLRLINWDWCTVSTDVVNVETAVDATSVQELLSFVLTRLNEKEFAEEILAIQTLSEQLPSRINSRALFENMPLRTQLVEEIYEIFSRIKLRNPEIYGTLNIDPPTSKFTDLCFELIKLEAQRSQMHQTIISMNRQHFPFTSEDLDWCKSCIYPLRNSGFFKQAIALACAIPYYVRHTEPVYQIITTDLFFKSNIEQVDKFILSSPKHSGVALLFADLLLTHNLDDHISHLPNLMECPFVLFEAFLAHGRLQKAFDLAYDQEVQKPEKMRTWLMNYLKLEEAPFEITPWHVQKAFEIGYGNCNSDYDRTWKEKTAALLEERKKYWAEKRANLS